MSKMEWFGIVRGHSRSLDIARFNRVRATFLLVFHINNVTILHHFSDIARYWLKIANCNLPTSFGAPGGIRILASLGYRMVLFA